MFKSAYFTQKRARRIVPALAGLTGFTALTALFLVAGCGGGSGSSGTNSPNRADRDLVFAVAQSVRATADNVDQVGDSADQETPTDAALEPLELDTDYNLYYRTTLGENPDVRLDYFEDAAASRPAGYLNTDFEGEFGQFPFQMTLVFDVTKGQRPERGDIALRLTSATNGVLEGTVTDYTSGDSVELDLTYSAADDSAVGMAIVTPGPRNHRTGDKPIYFTNLIAHADETFESSFRVGLGAGVPAGAVSLEEDRAGSLQMQVTEGTVRAQWDQDGRGTISYPGGFTETIPDFDMSPPS